MRRAFGHSQSCALSQPFCSEGWEMYKWGMMLFFCISSCVNCLWVCFFFPSLSSSSFHFLFPSLIVFMFCDFIVRFFVFIILMCILMIFFFFTSKIVVHFFFPHSLFQLVGHNLKIGHSLGLFWFVPGLLYYCRSFFFFIIKWIINAFFLVFRTKSEQTWALFLQNLHICHLMLCWQIYKLSGQCN